MKSALPLFGILITGCVFPSTPEESDGNGVQTPVDPGPGPGVGGTGAGGFPAGVGGAPVGVGGVAQGTGGMVAPSTGGTTAGTGGGGYVPSEPTGACDFPHTTLRDINSGAALAAAMKTATPGTMLRILPSTYTGDFEITASGTASQPIVLCSEGATTLKPGNPNHDVINLKGSHWIISGLTITEGLRGIMADGANNNQLLDLTVHNTGQEGIHFRSASSDNTVEGCNVYNTGTRDAGFGEGIYIGSAKSNWGEFGGGGPDRSNRNKILNNTIGPNVRAELIDVKEGTEDGVIRGNTFDGNGITGANFADSWMDIKGNDYVVDNNTGSNSKEDAFQTHVVDGWGHRTKFTNNKVTLNAGGYGFNIDKDSNGVQLSCNNEVSAAGNGFSNRSCN